MRQGQQVVANLGGEWEEFGGEWEGFQCVHDTSVMYGRGDKENWGRSSLMDL